MNYLKKIQKKGNQVASRFSEAIYAILGIRKGPLHTYSSEIPMPQNAAEIFKDEWHCRFPSPYQDAQTGTVTAFDDDRIHWAMKQLGGVQGKTILELGPLEGGHSYMLQKEGASSIYSVEANPRAYLKCLIVKEMFKLDRVTFAYGDFMEFLRQTDHMYDLCIACGVLYHMCSPAELIGLMAEHTKQIYIWTHYYDSAICGKGRLKFLFSSHTEADYQGFKHTLNRYHYRSSRSLLKFCGGPAHFSHWLTKEDIIACCHHFGFTRVTLHFDDPDHPHGPCFAFTAEK